MTCPEITRALRGLLLGEIDDQSIWAVHGPFACHFQTSPANAAAIDGGTTLLMPHSTSHTHSFVRCARLWN